MPFLYKKVLKPILFLFDAEFIHTVFISFGHLLGTNPITRKLVSFFYGYHGKDISKVVDGITYKTPIVLAAGFDYNAKLTNILQSVAFGGEEVGSVTARECAGNDKPRLMRLKKSGSIVVYKGLRNEGVDKIIERIKNSYIPKDYVVGISIARTNDEACNTLEEGVGDYLYSFKKLNDAGVGDYYTINISCPNSFGGEDFTTSERLNILLSKLSFIKTDKPVYLKMPINISWEDFEKLLEISLRFDFIKGYVIGNLNKNYDELDYLKEAPMEYRGGLSGVPCRKHSTDLIKKTKEKFGKTKTIIGCGGIMSVEDAQEKFEAGADLIQLITGMIFEGPHLMKQIAKKL